MKNLMIIMSVLLSAMVQATTYSGGVGTQEDPYEISTVGDWQTLTVTSADWGKYFILTTNLDFGGLSLTPVGNYTARFSGVFNGQGHIIHNFIINLPNNNYVGLFGYLSGVNSDAHLCNMGVENFNITGKDYVGGLVGYSIYGPIVSCYATGVVSGNYKVGGLIGEVDDSPIIACYATGVVSGVNSSIGGLVGNALQAPISFCYATNMVSGGYGPVGGLVGHNDSPVTSCFWDTDASGVNYSGGGIGLPTEIMQDSEIYLQAFWDFKGEIKNGRNDFWAMPVHGGYPVLAWQIDGMSAPINDEMSGALIIASGSSLAGASIGATGVDITANGYNDWADVWYYFDCGQSSKFTITVQDVDFDATLGVFDDIQKEVVFNDDFFGNQSSIILKAKSGERYYIRVSGYNGSTGNFSISVQQGAKQEIQGDINYDGKVNLIDFSIFAENWLLAE